METLLWLDFPTLWFLILGAIISGYAILDGFDLGAGALHLFLNDEKERRTALNSIGPIWNGNEVWLVIGGGALFAGFPVAYAALLSSMYIPFILFLFFIIFRGVAIEFRSKEPMPWWRRSWDTIYSLSSIMLALLLGIVLGNILQGIAITSEYSYSGGRFFEFLNPYALLTGLTSLTLFAMNGATFLLLKLEGNLFEKVAKLQQKTMIAFILCYWLTTLYTLLFIPHLTDKLKNNPVLFIIPVLITLSIANIPRVSSHRKYKQAFFFSSLTICLLLILTAIELYPNLLLSSIDPRYSIDIYKAASSLKTLKILVLFVAIGAPFALIYTGFSYKAFWGKTKLDENSY